MYTLQKKGEPAWLTLIPKAGRQPALEILVRPHDRKLRKEIARATRGLIPRLDPEMKVADMPPELWDQLEDAGEATTAATIRLGMLAWKGLSADGSTSLPFTPDNVEAFIADETLFEAADRLYVKPAAVRLAEKNGLSASPSGTGGAGTLGRAIASSAAGLTSRPRTPSAAKSASTAKTPSGPKRAKGSGRS